jgi:hypothetical protein
MRDLLLTMLVIWLILGWAVVTGLALLWALRLVIG